LQIAVHVDLRQLHEATELQRRLPLEVPERSRRLLRQVQEHVRDLRGQLPERGLQQLIAR
jgi:hypothetical protein